MLKTAGDPEILVSGEGKISMVGSAETNNSRTGVL